MTLNHVVKINRIVCDVVRVDSLSLAVRLPGNGQIDRVYRVSNEPVVVYRGKSGRFESQPVNLG